jgi:UTP--glucose-1-phosphate uridylyltransferase
MTESKWSELRLSPEETTILKRFGFDYDTFTRLRERLASGNFPLSANQVSDAITPPLPADLATLPAAGSAEAALDESRGREAMGRGEVAAVFLNGGMATRFGGVVKGVVEVVDGLSFLGLKLKDVARAGGVVPTFLMNSFATDAGTRRHLTERRAFGLPADRIHLVTQSVSIRLTPQGDIFREDGGSASLYAPGHGDLFAALATSADFQRFVKGGGKLVLVSNVDNVGATLSPRVVGAHLRLGRQVTVEVAERAPGDKGGAPARLRGHVEVLEGFRFPPAFDIETIPVFNTNTMIVDVEAVKATYPLTWFRADKTVGTRPAVQFERLMGEVTAFVESSYLVVPREGPEGRFLPVKTPEDLDQLRPAIRARFAARPS